MNLRVHPNEQKRLVVQLGSASPETALAAALKVEKDVAAIDLNCGCPKKFSVVGGMGSALLEDPDRLCAILDRLVSQLSIPVTCKIRLLDDRPEQTSLERTAALLKRIEATRVKAVGIHCRFTRERPREPGHWDVFDALASQISIPVIANGDLWSLDDIKRLKSTTGQRVASFMLARAAQSNVSVFSAQGPRPIQEVMERYVRYSVAYGMRYSNTKFVLLQMDEPIAGFRQKLIRLKSMAEICELFGLSTFYKEFEPLHVLIED